MVTIPYQFLKGVSVWAKNVSMTAMTDSIAAFKLVAKVGFGPEALVGAQD